MFMLGDCRSSVLIRVFSLYSSELLWLNEKDSPILVQFKDRSMYRFPLPISYEPSVTGLFKKSFNTHRDHSSRILDIMKRILSIKSNSCLFYFCGNLIDRHDVRESEKSYLDTTNLSFRHLNGGQSVSFIDISAKDCSIFKNSSSRF